MKTLYEEKKDLTKSWGIEGELEQTWQKDSDNLFNRESSDPPRELWREIWSQQTLTCEKERRKSDKSNEEMKQYGLTRDEDGIYWEKTGQTGKETIGRRLCRGEWDFLGKKAWMMSLK